MMKIVHAQTVLPEEELEELKRKTGEKATKDAIAKAIEHYLQCPYTHKLMEKRIEDVLREELRAPS